MITYDGTPIQGADVSSFLVSYYPNDHTDYEWSPDGPNTYAKDQKHVYWGHEAATDAVAGASIIIGADPNTFEPIYDRDNRFTGYARDKSHIYIDGNMFYPNVDVASFVVLPSGLPPDPYVAFSKDKYHVYTFSSGIVPNADPNSFSVIGVHPRQANSINNVPVYGEDSIHVFESVLGVPVQIIRGALPGKFIVSTST